MNIISRIKSAISNISVQITSIRLAFKQAYIGELGILRMLELRTATPAQLRKAAEILGRRDFRPFTEHLIGHVFRDTMSAELRKNAIQGSAEVLKAQQVSTYLRHADELEKEPEITRASYKRAKLRATMALRDEKLAEFNRVIAA